MKRPLFYWFGIVIIIMLGISACSTNMVTQQPNSSTSPQATAIVDTQASDGSITATAIVGSEAMILEKLQNHHGIDRVLSAKHTREEWNVTLDRMISYGAKINEDEKKAIIDYLLSR